MSVTTNLSREQTQFLKECLTEFANRFSEEDADYKNVLNCEKISPPIIYPWYGRPRLTATRSGFKKYQGRHRRDQYGSKDCESRYGRRQDRSNNYFKPY